MIEQEFAQVLDQLLGESFYSVRQLAEKAGLRPRTVLNWQTGRVRKPHQWKQVLKLAKALGLPEEKTNLVFQAAGHATLDILRTKEVDKEELELIAV